VASEVIESGIEAARMGDEQLLEVIFMAISMHRIW
jgi:hypothetical protein